MQEMMDVIVDGKIEKRPIDKIDGLHFSDGSISPVCAYPVMLDGETFVQVNGGIPHVVRFLD